MMDPPLAAIAPLETAAERLTRLAVAAGMPSPKARVKPNDPVLCVAEEYAGVVFLTETEFAASDEAVVKMLRKRRITALADAIRMLSSVISEVTR